MSTSIPFSGPAPTVVHNHSHAQRARMAFEELSAEIQAVDPKDYVQMNLDIPGTAMLVLGVAPNILHYRADVAAELNKFRISIFDRITDYAMATWYCHTQFQAASQPLAPIQELADELTKLREIMLSDATALAKRNLIDGSKLKDLQGPQAFKNLANDSFLLARLFRDSWEKIIGKTAVQMSELDRAEEVAYDLASAVGLRDQGPNVASATAELRQKAFTLLVNEYDEVRRAITFLRWVPGDADEIAPSLYSGRTGSSKKKPDPNQPAPNGNAPNGNGATSNGSGVAPNGVTPGAVVTGPTATSPIAPIAPSPRVADATARAAVAPGMPGNDPFGR